MPVIRKRRHADEPLNTEVHAALAAVGVDPTATSVSDPLARGVEATTGRIAEAVDAAIRASDDDRLVFAASFAKFVAGVPHKITAYAALLRRVGARDAALAEATLAKCAEALADSAARCDWHALRQHLRFFGWLARCRAAPPATGLLEALLDSSSIGGSAAAVSARDDAVAQTVLAVLPWFGRTAAAAVLPRIEEYMAKRTPAHSLLPARPLHTQQYNFVPSPVAGATDDASPDYLELLYAEVSGAHGGAPSVEGLLPTYAENGSGAAGAWVSTAAVELPHLPAHSRGVVHPDASAALCLFHLWEDGAATGSEGRRKRRPVRRDVPNMADNASPFMQIDETAFDQREAMHYVDRTVLRELTLDLMHAFHADVELLYAALLQLPSRVGTNRLITAFVVVDAVLSSALTLPHAPLPSAFYSSLLVRLCKDPVSPYTLPVVEGFEALCDAVPTLDPEVTLRVTQLFATHVSNHNFKWMWETLQKDDSQDRRAAACKMLFWFEMMHQFTRCAPKEALVAAIPGTVDRSRVLQADAGLRYKYADADVPFKRDADRLLRKMRDAEEGSEIVDEVVQHLSELKHGSAEGTETDRAEVLVNCLLLLGSDCVAHEIFLMRQYAPAFKKAVADGSAVVRAAQGFWDSEPHKIKVTVGNLLQHDIVSPVDVVRWAVTGDLAERLERSFIWETVFMSLDRLTRKVWAEFEALVDLEGAVQELEQLNAPAAAKEKAKKQLGRKIAKIEMVLHGVYLVELRDALKTLFTELARTITAHGVRERKELRAAMQGSEREQRQTAARHFLWRRAAVGNFNAAGRRYLPFMLPFIDEIYEEALIGAKAPQVLFYAFLGWRDVRGKRAMPQSGGNLLWAEGSPLQSETLRRVSEVSVGGAVAKETMFDRLDNGSLQVGTILQAADEIAAAQEAEPAAESGSEDGETGDSDSD